jgi:hypothetical protein
MHTDEQNLSQKIKKENFTTIKNVLTYFFEEFYFQYLSDFFLMVLMVVYDHVDVYINIYIYLFNI